MGVRLRYVIVLSLIGMAFSLSVGRAQFVGAMASGTGVVSASVVVTWMTHSEAGASTLDLAVLWRGAPGWFTAGDASGRSGGGTSTVLADGRSGPESHYIAVGGLRLEVRFDPMTRRAQIQDEVISLQGANVILVDEVDSATGPTIVDRMWVEPRFPDSSVDIEAVVRRAPGLFPFLRCDVRFPDQPQRPRIEVTTLQQMTDLMCARLRGQ